ncbi:MAG: hypothetical protein AB4426_04815 [Xenococcaceae cyanobacterium]
MVAERSPESQKPMKDFSDWDREEQIRKNQAAIQVIREWLNEDISEEEKKAREEQYEIFRKILLKPTL